MNYSNQEIIEQLRKIIQKTKADEKHRGYHLLPERLNKLSKENINPKHVFYEKERLSFIKSRIDVTNKSILDIGCNTGYLLFDLLDSGAKKVTGYEGKPLCTEFLPKAIELLNEHERFVFHNMYFNFNTPLEKFDAALLLNVLHHIGDDYGDRQLTIEKAKEGILNQLNSMANHTSILIYQMGFNWQGNIKTCLFENGTKAEMIEYMRNGTKGVWQIESIGIPEKNSNGIEYKELNENNIKRDDSLGEFLNRPLFVLRSLKTN
jgi:SAM-dependent methyltransferase